MDKVSKLTGTVALGTAALVGMPSAAEAVDIAEVEPNDTFHGQDVPMNVSDRVVASIDGATDIDFFHITGLPAGGTAAFNFDGGGGSNTLEAGIYTSGGAPTTSVDFGSNSTLLPAEISNGGDLVLGVKAAGAPLVLEGYKITLQAVSTVERVPEPATLVLLGAGLAGLHVMRRRQRG